MPQEHQTTDTFDAKPSADPEILMRLNQALETNEQQKVTIENQQKQIRQLKQLNSDQNDNRNVARNYESEISDLKQETKRMQGIIDQKSEQLFRTVDHLKESEQLK